MKRALSLARRGGWAVRPNPRVGAVLVRSGKVIAAGYHSRFGGPHAEARVIKKAGKEARGAAIYVTLEPCSTYGKTPPCTDLLIRTGVKRVVIGSLDRHPANRGRACPLLAAAGIKVETGVLEEECRELNHDFFTWAEENRPYSVLKMASSLDGRIASRTGDARWISSELSRRYAHRLRRDADAILVGLGTIRADNPRLTVRMGYHRPGLRRVILDSRGEIPLAARVLEDVNRYPAILATTPAAPPRRMEKLIRRGVEWMKIPSRGARVDLRPPSRRRAALGVMRILIEGGAETAASALKEGLVDELHLFIAPMIIGGRSAVSAVGGEGVKRIKDAYRLRGMMVERLGPDIHVSGRIERSTLRRGQSAESIAQRA